MARITFGTGLDGDAWLEDFYNVDQLKLVSKSATKAVYRDGNGDQIVLTGSGLGYSGNFATKGTVSVVQFVSGSGEKFLTISDGAFKASAVFAEIKDKAFFDLLSVLTAGHDVIKGTDSGNDIIIGTNKGNDKIYGLGGDDFIKGSAGNDIIDGGAGWNTLAYTETFYHLDGVKSGIIVDVVAGKVKNSWGGTDTVKNIKGYEGTNLVDRFYGGKDDDSFMGLKGNDKLVGGKGADEARYHKDARFGATHGIVADLAKGKIEDGFGTVDTVESIEHVIGTQSRDVYYGDGADNQFRGLGGKDSFSGGGGTDTVSFDFWEDVKGQRGVVVDLRKTSGQIVNDGYGNTENVKSIERIDGSHFDDRITLGSAKGGVWGGAGNDRLSAGSGENWLDGGDGNDRLVAGVGENWMRGGNGRDVFVFSKARDSMKGTTTRDFIDDFSRGQGDKIDLSAFDVSFKDVKTVVNDLGNTIVTVNVTGDIDLQFLISGKLALTSADFLW